MMTILIGHQYGWVSNGSWTDAIRRPLRPSSVMPHFLDTQTGAEKGDLWITSATLGGHSPHLTDTNATDAGLQSLR
jgi:hypothetical protein